MFFASSPTVCSDFRLRFSCFFFAFGRPQGSQIRVVPGSLSEAIREGLANSRSFFSMPNRGPFGWGGRRFRDVLGASGRHFGVPKNVARRSSSPTVCSILALPGALLLAPSQWRFLGLGKIFAEDMVDFLWRL